MSIGQLGIKIAKTLRKNLGLSIGEIGGSKIYINQKIKENKHMFILI